MFIVHRQEVQVNRTKWGMTAYFIPPTTQIWERVKKWYPLFFAYDYLPRPGYTHQSNVLFLNLYKGLESSPEEGTII